MTVIVGYEDQTGVYIGGDSCLSNDWARENLAYPKVFEVKYNVGNESETVIMGGTGTLRHLQLLQYKLGNLIGKIQKADESEEHYLVTTFTDAIKTVLKDNGAAVNDKGEEWFGGDFILGYRGKLYCIQGDYSVVRAERPFQSVGCGFICALGAMEALQLTKADLKPQDIINIAIQATAQYNPFVSMPVTILHQSADGKNIEEVK